MYIHVEGGSLQFCLPLSVVLVVSGHWSVVSGQWSVVCVACTRDSRCRRLDLTHLYKLGHIDIHD